MKSTQLALGAVLAFATPALAETGGKLDAPVAGGTLEAPVAGGTLEAPEAQPVEPTTATSPTDAVADTGEVAQDRPVLGPMEQDARGRTGRIHTVRAGDTLWDVSETYLGTPWIWPSIWQDNAAITDPDLIHPGDRLWITAEEMRRVSEAEAAELLAAGEELEFPASMDGDLDGLPEDEDQAPRYRYVEIDTTGFVGIEEVRGSATIVDAAGDRNWLGDHDEVVIGLGAGAVSVGDRLAIIRPLEKVFGVDRGLVLGHATRELGWLEVTDVHPETATAIIRLARGEIRRGDRVLPREVRDPDVVVTEAPEVEGHIVYTPSSRLEMGSTDVVYLDRGTNAGIAVGNPLEIYRPLGIGEDAVTGSVQMPDHVIAKLIVVEAHPLASVAVVTHTTEEISRGARFRGSATFEP